MMSAQPAIKNPEGEQANLFSLSQLYVYLTKGCNLRCSHCWLSPKFDATGGQYPMLPVELFERAIDEAQPLGLTRVKLTGGEPLLHPQIVTLLNILRQKQLAVTIETNGLLCTPALASEIASLPERFVSVSIDGVEAATHDSVRGIPGAFRLACQAVRNLVAVATPPQIIMSLMRCNVDQIELMIRMAEDLGAESVKFNVVQPTGRGDNIHNRDGQRLSIGELISLGRWVETELAVSTHLKLFFDYPPAFRALSRIHRENGGSRCGIMGILGILASGEYALCGIGEHVPELVFGAIADDRLASVWEETTLLRELREGLPERLQGVCRRCLMKYQCFGSCLAQNYYRSRSLWAPFWFCEEAEHLGLFPVSRCLEIDSTALQRKNNNDGQDECHKER